MIFVTVGTTRFDELVEAVDRIAPALGEDVIIQAGNHKYVPRNCEYFNFTNDFINYLNQADIIVAHGGAGITFEVLNMQKKLISIANPHTLESHQTDLIGKLSQEGYLIWCKDLNHLDDTIKDARRIQIKKYVKPECGIGNKILEWLE